MSEEDTFLALKRAPFRVLFLHCTLDIKLGEDVGGKHKEYLNKNGWSLAEFQQEVFDRKIPLSAGVIHNDEWRQKFRDGEVY
jgi:hypothetical protein